MSQKNRILLLVGLVVLLGVAIYLVQTLTPTEEEELPEKVDFKASAIAGDKEITFKYSPQTVEEATYVVSYEITEGTSTLEAVQEKEIGQTSAENPIAINITRKATSSYAIDMTIKDAQERTVYQGSLSVEQEEEEKPQLPIDKKEQLVSFMEENAPDIVEKEPVLGGSWHFVEMEAVDAEKLLVNATFGDGHIQQRLQIDFNITEDQITYEIVKELEEKQTGAQFQEM